MKPEDKNQENDEALEQSTPEAQETQNENGGAQNHAAADSEEPAAGEESAEAATEPSASGLEEAQARAAENWDKFLRLQAEFENFKKRMHKEQSESLKYAHLPVLREMVGILDNFERAVEHARGNATPELEGIISGIDMVIQQMGGAFGKFGMTPIEARGETFDPTRHEAMSVRETDEVPENQVVEVFQSGYLLHDRVVRPAMVVVSKKPAAAKT